MARDAATAQKGKATLKVAASMDDITLYSDEITRLKQELEKKSQEMTRLNKDHEIELKELARHDDMERAKVMASDLAATSYQVHQMEDELNETKQKLKKARNEAKIRAEKASVAVATAEDEYMNIELQLENIKRMKDAEIARLHEALKEGGISHTSEEVLELQKQLDEKSQEISELHKETLDLGKTPNDEANANMATLQVKLVEAEQQNSVLTHKMEVMEAKFDCKKADLDLEKAHRKEVERKLNSTKKNEKHVESGDEEKDTFAADRKKILTSSVLSDKSSAAIEAAILIDEETELMTTLQLMSHSLKSPDQLQRELQPMSHSRMSPDHLQQDTRYLYSPNLTGIIMAAEEELQHMSTDEIEARDILLEQTYNAARTLKRQSIQSQHGLMTNIIESSEELELKRRRVHELEALLEREKTERITAVAARDAEIVRTGLVLSDLKGYVNNLEEKLCETEIKAKGSREEMMTLKNEELRRQEDRIEILERKLESTVDELRQKTAREVQRERDLKDVVREKDSLKIKEEEMEDIIAREVVKLRKLGYVREKRFDEEEKEWMDIIEEKDRELTEQAKRNASLQKEMKSTRAELDSEFEAIQLQLKEKGDECGRLGHEVSTLESENYRMRMDMSNLIQVKEAEMKMLQNVMAGLREELEAKENEMEKGFIIDQSSL